MKSRFLLPLAAALSLPSLLPAQEGVDLDQLGNLATRLLEENQEEIREAIGQLEGRAEELRNRMVDEQVPTAVYDRLEVSPVSESALQGIQASARRAIEREYSWAQYPVLAALRYQNDLRGNEEVGYESVHLRCELDSPENPTEAVVTIIEDGVLDDAIRGTRWDLVLQRDEASGCWVPSAAYQATLERTQ